MNSSEWTEEELLKPYASSSGGNCENGDYTHYVRFCAERAKLIDSLSTTRAANESAGALARLTPDERELLLANPGVMPITEKDEIRLARLLLHKEASLAGVTWDTKGVMAHPA